ncbi:MAG: AMP-binding protein [Sphingomonadaceae bacterium]|nr:AMP-binding protein [Sphingomonadaceae bacterium]
MLTRPDGLRLWMPDTTVSMLERAAATWPNAIALVYGDERLSYAEYEANVRALARKLVALGATGKHVVILLPNSLDIAVAIFAVQAAGSTSVTLNPDYSAAELGPILDQVRPVLAIANDDLHARLLDLLPADALVASISMLTASQPEQIFLPVLRPDSIAVLQFTGGTTGSPKGAMLSHRAVATNVVQREAVLPTNAADEQIICMMPLYHSFAAAMCLHLTAYAGGTLHILPRYRPDWVLDCIEREHITRLPAGPTLFNSLLGFDGLTRERVASLRCAYSGSAPLPQDTLSRWEALTGVPIYEGYGQSEAGPVLTYHGPDMRLKQGSVGPPLPLTEIEIVGGGVVGEIRARGPQVMDGYLDRPDETAATLINGWLYTGDIGRIDEDGYVFIEDRKKDMAIVGGFNVYPREIDEVLMQLPAVREAGAIGVPDAYRGEVIWAYIVADNLDPETVEMHCAASLVKYKRPSAIRFIEALPRTNVGKIDKQALKAMARAELDGGTDVA